MKYITELDPNLILFPHPKQALESPDGLLAVGGDLSSRRLLKAYRNGIFPWYSADEPIMWWSPSVRGVIRPELFVANKSLRKAFRKGNYKVTINHVTQQVIDLCASTRDKDNTWITDEMRFAYHHLTELGLCHSFEVWENEQLVGGLYGLHIGQAFCGESMFSLQSNASKIAFWYLCQHFSQHGGQLIDCQLMNSHLKSLGVVEQNRADFLLELKQLKDRSVANDCFVKQQIFPLN